MPIPRSKENDGESDAPPIKKQKLIIPYTLKKLTRRVKRCQGCRELFEHQVDDYTIAHYENNPFYSKHIEDFHDAWRNYYYHADVNCIKIVNPDYNQELTVNTDLTPLDSNMKEQILKSGFILV